MSVVHRNNILFLYLSVQIPQLHASVVAARGERPSIGRVGDGPDNGAVPFESSRLVTGHVPEPYGAISAPGRQCRAIWRKGQGSDF